MVELYSLQKLVAAATCADAEQRCAELQPAIQTATQEPGVTRADVAPYMAQLGRQNTSAMAQVQQHLQESTAAQQRALHEQATYFAEQLV